MTTGKQRVCCPQCGSRRLWRDGVHPRKNGDAIQRWLCRDCGYRFLDPAAKRYNPSSLENFQKNPPLHLKTANSLDSNCRVGVWDFQAKNSAKSGKTTMKSFERQEGTEVAETKANPPNIEIKGKIVEYSFWMLKQGYAESTIKGRTKLLKRLLRLGANLHDPESVKEVIAKQKWSTSRKANAVDAYTNFLQMQSKKWNPPIYRRVRKLPFIPTENELDQLISGCSRRMATFLQLLKETGMRCGEACQLKWTDIDLVNNSVRVTPEKGGNPRNLKISNKLVSMLSAMLKDSAKVFNSNTDVMRRNFTRQRKRIAAKLKNPRINQITFHTFRHWKATMEYHKTKDILHVKELLGHKSINNTLIYTQLVSFEDDEFTARVAHSEKEACELVEAGFEYVCDFNGNKIFRKRK